MAGNQHFLRLPASSPHSLVVVVRVFSTLLSEETPREISNKGTFSNIFSGRQNLVTTRESILEWGGESRELATDVLRHRNNLEEKR